MASDYWIVPLAAVASDVARQPVTPKTQADLRRRKAVTRAFVGGQHLRKIQRDNYATLKWRTVPDGGVIDPRISKDGKLMLLIADQKPSPTSQGPFDRKTVLAVMATSNWRGDE